MQTKSGEALASPRERTDWFSIFALFIAGLAASMHFAKVAPVMDRIGGDLHLSLIASGLAVSVLGMVGVLFAISAGAVVASIGLQRGLMIGLLGGAVIATAAAAAPTGALFLTLRFFEGFSHLLVVVCAPALMAQVATRRDRPIALAIWGCFFGLGFAITSVVAPVIVPVFGWRGLLLSHAGALAGAGALAATALARSGLCDSRAPFPGAAALISAHSAVYRSGAPLLLALTFCAYTMQFLAVLTFLGRFLLDVRNMSQSGTGNLIAGASLVTLAATLSAGFLVRSGVPLFTGLMLAFVMTSAAAAGVFWLVLPPSGMYLSILVMMAGYGLMPGFVFANVPTVAPTPARAALAYGAIAQFGNVGTFTGTPLFAALYQTLGWPGGAVFVAGLAAGGIALAWTLKERMAT